MEKRSKNSVLFGNDYYHLDSFRKMDMDMNNLLFRCFGVSSTVGGSTTKTFQLIMALANNLKQTNLTLNDDDRMIMDYGTGNPLVKRFGVSSTIGGSTTKTFQTDMALANTLNNNELFDDGSEFMEFNNDNARFTHGYLKNKHFGSIGGVHRVMRKHTRVNSSDGRRVGVPSLTYSIGGPRVIKEVKLVRDYHRVKYVFEWEHLDVDGKVATIPDEEVALFFWRMVQRKYKCKFGRSMPMGARAVALKHLDQSGVNFKLHEQALRVRYERPTALVCVTNMPAKVVGKGKGMTVLTPTRPLTWEEVGFKLPSAVKVESLNSEDIEPGKVNNSLFETKPSMFSTRRHANRFTIRDRRKFALPQGFAEVGSHLEDPDFDVIINEAVAALKTFRELGESVRDPRFDSILTRVDTLVGKLSEASERIGSSFNCVETIFGNALLLGQLANCVYFFQSGSWHMFIMSVILAVATFFREKITFEMMTGWLSHGVSNYFSRDTKEVGHAESFSLRDAAESLARVVVGLAGSIIGKIPSYETIKKVVMGLGLITTLERALTSLPKLINVLSDKFKDILVWLNVKDDELSGMSHADARRVREWAIEVGRVCNDDTRVAMMQNDAMRQNILALKDEGVNIIAKYTSEQHISVAINQLFKKVSEFADDALKFSDAYSIKLEPFHVSFIGNPGTSKSNVANYYALEAALRVGYRETEALYTKSATTDHYDGLHRQHALMFDDICQFKDTPEANKELADFIAIKSPNPFIPSQAALGDKGRPLLQALLLTTSNVPYPRLNVMMSQEAFWRRRDMLVAIDVIDECKENGKPNKKLMLEYGQTNGFLSYVRAKFLQPLEEVPAAAWTYDGGDEWMEMNDMLDFLHDAYDSYMESQAYITRNRVPVRRALSPRELVRHLLTVDSEDNIIVPPEQEDFWHRLSHKPEYDTKEKILALYKSTGVKESPSKISWAIKPKLDSFVALIKSWSQKVYNLWKETCARVWNMPRVKKILAMLGVAVPILTGLVLYKTYSTGQIESGDQQTRFVQKTRAVKRLGAAEADANAVDMIDNKMVKTMFQITIMRGSTCLGVCLGMGIKGKIILVPAHLFIGVEQNDRMEIRMNGALYTELFDNDKLLLAGEQDIALYMMGPSFPARKDMTRNFMSEKEFRHGTLSKAWIVGLGQRVYVDAEAIDVASGVMEYSHKDRRMILRRGWRYPNCTSRGDCGAMLVVDNVRFAGKIMGMHVSKDYSQRYSYAECVVREDLEALMERFLYRNVVIGDTQLVNYGDAEADGIWPPGNYSLLGTLPRSERVRQPIKTDIVPSEIHDMVEVHATEPSVLTPSDTRLETRISPLLLGLEKYSTEQGLLDPTIDHLAYASLQRELLKIVPQRSNVGLLSTHDALNGVPSIPYMDAMNMQSSAGYPWVLNRATIGKIGPCVWDEDELCWKTSDLLHEVVEAKLEAASRGELIPSTFVDSLKDERRKLAKIKSGNTRIFTAAPVEFTIVMRRCMLDFFAAFYASRDNIFSAIGIDAEGGEWTSLLDYLLSCSNVGFDGDYSNFDGNISPGILDRCRQFCQEWYDMYGSLHENYLRVIFEEVIHTQQLNGGNIYQSHKGMPSGCAGTAPINTIANAYATRYAFYSAMLKGYDGSPDYHLNYLSPDSFDKVIRMKAYGDDILVAVDADMVERFNLRIMSHELSSIGMKFGAADKSENLYDVRPIRELTFLKRGFMPFKEKCGPRWLVLANIDKVTIHELFNWIRRCPDPREALRVNIDTAMRFAYYWQDRQYFKELRNKVICACKEVGLPVVVPTWEDNRRTLLLKLNMAQGNASLFSSLREMPRGGATLGETEKDPSAPLGKVGGVGGDKPEGARH